MSENWLTASQSPRRDVITRPAAKSSGFQQAMKKWLATQPDRPGHDRPAAGPARRLRRGVQPPAAAPVSGASSDSGDRLHQPAPRPPPATAKTTPTTGSAATASTRRKITLRYQGKLYSIGIGRTRVIVLVQDLDIRVVDAATGELLRELVLDPSKNYQGTGRPPGPNR
jgi:hypothetical protein